MLEQREIIFDSDLNVEGLLFNGIKQKFPNHFHEYYVIGCIEQGARKLHCKGQEYTLLPGDLILLNPYDNHECLQLDSCPLVYRNIHIEIEVMATIMEDHFNSSVLPLFHTNVVSQSKEVPTLQILHRLILDNSQDSLEKEELFLLLLSELLTEYADYQELNTVASFELDKICTYLNQHYSEKIALTTLSHLVSMNKYTFIRTFTKSYGLTPFQYLTTIRVNQAKKLLEQGIAIADIAHSTGFSDQSHLTRLFKSLIGVTPKMYQKIYSK
ncbi:AraC family transcriptional regulator [Enterococcus rivorum]|uniref:HTH araC/xylS-type domain-containing protein n=1 Tax=Enterococcus rivorum TaxID=762845 RepID=A0A1E5KTE3_9ENTE|nr:AraC family transcriptional regulator [Enterococcus rivorum]MBP2098089.1 AraC-like DNA-binding protein [Enterococcus rivorum]OEH81028.1 hypothetical protein BCR26_05825 [Enterococcus rivorum]